VCVRTMCLCVVCVCVCVCVCVAHVSACTFVVIVYACIICGVFVYMNLSHHCTLCCSMLQLSHSKIFKGIK